MLEFEQLVRYLFDSITASDSHPQIDIVSTQDLGYQITVTAAESNIGQLIGKEGKIIKAIRTLLNVAYPTTRYQIDFTPVSSSPVSEVSTDLA